MTTAVSIALLAVAISLFAVFSSIQTKKTTDAKRQSDGDSGTITMSSDGGADCSPSASDAGCDSGGGDGGGGGGD